MSSLLLSCPSGIAGNMWLAALLALGADPDTILELPNTLGLGTARIDWSAEQRSEGMRTDLEVLDIDPAVDGGFDDLVERLGLALPPDLHAIAVDVLHRRRQGDAGSAFAVAALRGWGSEFSDTLVDVAGGVLAWHLVGRPRVTTRASVATGTASDAVRAVLDPVPHHPTSCPDPLVTSTGAALLRQFWTTEPVPQGPPQVVCEVWSAFGRRHNLPPMTAALYS